MRTDHIHACGEYTARFALGAPLHWPVPSPDHPGTPLLPASNPRFIPAEQIALEPEQPPELILA